MGDFCQLPPNDDQSLVFVLASFQGYGNNILTQENPDSIIVLEAAQLFSNFKRVVLKEQMRAADDPVHCATIERFSLCNKQSPITKKILRGLQRLTPELLRKDDKFNDAVIVVQSNEERVLLGRLKAISYAKNHGEPVFSWVLNMITERKGGDKERSKSYVQAGAKELEFYFVQGDAHDYILQRKNRPQIMANS